MECNKLISPMAVAVVSYSFCSGSLLLLNKMVLRRIPNAPAVTVIQLFACIVAITLSHLLGLIKLERISATTLKAFSLYSFLFALGVYTNMRALQVSNVDTVIVFRACVPLVVAAADYLWLGRELPSCRSFGAMLVVGLGAVGYVLIDSAFALNGVAAYGWVSLYFVAIAAEMVLGKIITSGEQVQLGVQVLLTNAMSLPLMLIIGSSSGELGNFSFDILNASNVPLLTISCIVGAGIGFSGWWCRSLVSATSFTVIGILNKLLTVFLNILVWDNHSSTIGTLCLLGCLVGGSLYRQSPMRPPVCVKPVAIKLDPLPESIAIEMPEIEVTLEPSQDTAQLIERTRTINSLAKTDDLPVVDPKAL